MSNANQYLVKAEEFIRELAHPSPPALEILKKVHRYSEWSLDGFRTRGAITVTAEKRLADPNQIELLWLFADNLASHDICRKALLAIGQLGGEESVERAIILMGADGTDAETKLYCLAPLRNIGGPAAVRVLVRALGDARPEMQNAAMSGILDLAAAEFSSRAREVRLPRSPVVLKVLHELQEGLLELEQRMSAPFRLRFQAAEALDYMEKSGVLPSATIFPRNISPTGQEMAHSLGSVWQRAYTQHHVTGGSGGRLLKPDDGSITVQVPLIRADGREEKVAVKILPIPDFAKSRFEQVGHHIYLSQDQTVVITAQIPEEVFPEYVVEIRVSAVTSDGSEELADKTLTRGGSTGLLAFAIPEALRREWCKNPRLLLRQAK